MELCNPVTAFCVKFNCDDGKKSDVLFSLFKKKSIFVYSVFFSFGKISIVHFILLIVVFFTEKMWF